jgi:hypothetical protein
LGIPPFNRKHRPWTPAEDALLGRMPDEKLARRLNRSMAAVTVRRNNHRIPKLISQRSTPNKP